MVQYAVYERPLDFPNSYVARKWYIEPGKEPRPEKESFAISPTLEGIRALIPAGLTCLPRLPNDDPVIVEVWI